MTTVLITGGGGFIALNIAEALLACDRKVVLFGTSIPPEPFLHRLGVSKDLHCETGDVTNGAAVSEALTRHGVNQVVHGAVITAALEREAREAVRIAEVNLIGTIKVLEASIAAGIQRVICLGSGSVYGAQVKTEGLLNEDKDLAVPDSMYGITKLAAERMAMRYRATRGLDVVVARLGVVLGPWEHNTRSRDTLSIPYVLLELARNGQEARIMRHVPNDWIYAADAATAIVTMLDAKKLNYGVYHVSAGMQWDIGDWCRAVQAHFPAFTWRLVDNPEEANVGRLSPVPRPPFSIDRITSELGWRPNYLGTDALLHMLKWYDQK